MYFSKPRAELARTTPRSYYHAGSKTASRVRIDNRTSATERMNSNAQNFKCNPPLHFQYIYICTNTRLENHMANKQKEIFFSISSLISIKFTFFLFFIFFYHISLKIFLNSFVRQYKIIVFVFILCSFIKDF